MPRSFPDGVRCTPAPTAPPSQAVESTEETPKRCFVCCGNPAILIPIGGHLGQVQAFCSERCAAIHGLRVFKDSQHTWCNYCGAWTEDNATCHVCGKRYVIGFKGIDFDDDLFDLDTEGVTHDPS